jgi:GalNAc-alpha-(1->4)-GalNAc-alpha-(1->3)-diNAcBac-PP-undecaprenol alpha-1,4-N-acetyl-D-galactosaminyltransferase
MNKSKIAFILYSLGPGGAERVVSTLANELNKEHKIYIITFSGKEPFYHLDQGIDIIPCFERIRPSKNVWEALRNNYMLVKAIKKQVKAAQIDLLIGFMTSANVLATVVAKLTGKPIIISERNNPSKERVTGFWKLLRRVSYPFANHLVVQTSQIQDYYTSKVRKERLCILPNPISPQLSQHRNHTEVKQNIVLNVGSLTRQKAQHVLIKAFARTQATDWKLIIVGEGPERVKLQTLINELELQGQVELPGRIKEVYRMYNTSKIFAFSSLYEGFPNALIEAMHFGLPCISTDCPTGPSELIENGINGYLISLNGEKAMAEKLNYLMENEEMGKIMGEKAIHAVNKYELPNVISLWNDLITRCLN